MQGIERRHGKNCMADFKTTYHALPDTEPDEYIACHECAALHRKIPLGEYALAHCARCGAVLFRRATGRIDVLLALALTSAILLIIANSFPIVELQTSGMSSPATLLGAIGQLWREKMFLVAAMMFGSTVLFTAIELGALIYVLAPLAIGRRAPGVKAVIRLIQAARPWGMIEVFMLGTLITLVKLSRAADLTLGPALFAFIALSMLLACLSAFEPRHLWHSAASDGSSCPRKTNSIGRTWALLLAAAILYIPANLLPVMHTRSLLGVQDDTIISGIVFFWNSGSWAIAIIIFVASVVVPLLKLAALALLAFTAQRGMRGGQRARARLYRLIERIGRWSMLDVFVVMLTVALMRFGTLIEMSAGSGALAFGAVVILTMLASMQFDPRLIWRSADSPEPDSTASS